MKNIILFFVSLCVLFPAFGKSYLAEPTGQYSVGFQDMRLVNGISENGVYKCPEKTDLFYIKGKNEKDFGTDNQIDFCREIMLRVYYPMSQNKHSQTKYFNPFALQDLQNEIRNAKIPGMTEISIKEIGNIKDFSIDMNKQKNSKIANQKFPVLIFDPGWGENVQSYTNIIGSVVSHGYIVLAINNTFLGKAIQFPDNRTVFMAPIDVTASQVYSRGKTSVLNDILFVRHLVDSTNQNQLSNFKNHMQLDKIGIFGHSIGGMALIQAIRDNGKNFQAGIALDALPMEFGTHKFSKKELNGFDVPIMRMFAADWKKYDELPKDLKFDLRDNNFLLLLSPDLKNDTYTAHMSYTDMSTLQYQPAIKLFFDSTFFPFEKCEILRRIAIVGTANGMHEIKLMNIVILNFFNMYLKNESSQNLKKCVSFSNDSILECGKSK